MFAKKQVRQVSAEDHRKNLRKRFRKTIRERLFDEAVSEPISVPKTMKNLPRIAPKSTFWPQIDELGSTLAASGSIFKLLDLRVPLKNFKLKKN